MEIDQGCGGMCMNTCALCKEALSWPVLGSSQPSPHSLLPNGLILVSPCCPLLSLLFQKLSPSCYLNGCKGVGHAAQGVVHTLALLCSLAQRIVVPGQQDAVEPVVLGLCMYVGGVGLLTVRNGEGRIAVVRDVSLGVTPECVGSPRLLPRTH